MLLTIFCKPEVFALALPKNIIQIKNKLAKNTNFLFIERKLFLNFIGRK